MVHFFESADRWRKVTRKLVGTREVGLWDVAVEGRKRNDGAEVTSFIITEFSDKWKARDLLIELKELGEIVDVVIPSKRDRRGRRYSFTRSINVEDEKLLAIKLDNVILEGRKLFANFPRLQRPVIDKDTNKGLFNKVVKGVRVQDRNHKGWVDNKSFVEIITNRKHMTFETGEPSSIRTLNMHVEEVDLIRYEREFTRVLKDTEVSYEIKNFFLQEGIFTIRVMMLGPNLFLLEDLIFGEVEIFIEERRRWWEQWFRSIRAWDPKYVYLDIFVWLWISGIPCHA